MNKSAVLALIGLALFLAGCNVEPQTGTRVVFAFPPGKAVNRTELVKLSDYLKTKGELVLGVKGPRVDKVDAHSLTLLLPGKRIPKNAIQRLIEPASIELYYLPRVATPRSPRRPWKLQVPISAKAPYLFLGANAQRIDSKRDPQQLLVEVVGYPDVKPVLTGRDILPTAVAQEMTQGWAVQVQFTKSGARILHDFTRHNIGEYLAIFYNGHLISAPLIKEAIPGGSARITGFATQALARGAVSDLNAGALPTQVRITRVEYYR